MYVIPGLVVLLFVLVYLLSRKDKAKSIIEKEVEPEAEIDPNCCGAHEECDKTAEEMLIDASKYFEDEDLDRFSDQKNVEFSDGEIEEFREILYTLKRNEISTWLSSLEFRKVTTPHIIRDEALLLLQD